MASLLTRILDECLEIDLLSPNSILWLIIFQINSIINTFSFLYLPKYNNLGTFKSAVFLNHKL